MTNLHWKEIDRMGDIDLWALIVVKLSELGILKSYLYIPYIIYTGAVHKSICPKAVQPSNLYNDLVSNASLSER